MKLISLLICLLLSLHKSAGSITDICTDGPSDAYTIGETYTFTCPCSDCSQVVFRKFSSQAGGEGIMVQQATVLINNTIQLEMMLTSTDMGGYYRCCLNHCSNPNNVLGFSRVRIGASPGPPLNVSCYAKGFKDLHCSWKHDVQQTKRFPVHYWGHFANTQYDNPRADDFRWQDGSKAVGNPKFQVELPGNQEQTYYVRLCARNIFNCTCGIHRLGTLFDIMSPNAVANLDVTSVTASSIDLSWKTPSDLEYSLDSVIYRVDWFAVDATIDSLHTNVTVPNRTDMRVGGLLPHTLYNLAVYPRPYNWEARKPTGFWGTPSHILVRTKPDVPRRAPEIDPGMYFRHSCPKDDRNDCITFYWRPLPKDKWTADLIYYHLKVVETIQESPKRRQTSFHNISHTDFKHVCQANKTENRVQVELRACNEIGCSSPSSIVVPPKGFIHPIELSGYLMNGSVQSVSWNGPLDLNYIVYWCEKGRNGHCKDSSQGNLQRKDPGTNMTIQISLNDSGLHSFAVSALKFDEHLKRNISGGMFWFTESTLKVSVQSVNSKIKDVKVIISVTVVGALVLVLIFPAVWYFRSRRKAIKREEDAVPLPELNPILDLPNTRKQTDDEEVITMLLDRFKPTTNSDQYLTTTEVDADNTDVYGIWDEPEKEHEGYPRETQNKTEYGALYLESSSESSEYSTSGYPEDLEVESDSGAFLYSTGTSKYDRKAASDALQKAISAAEFSEDAETESCRHDTGYGAFECSGEENSYSVGNTSHAVLISESSDTRDILAKVSSNGVKKDDQLMFEQGCHYGVADFGSASGSYNTELTYVEQPEITKPSEQLDNSPSLLKDSSNTFGSDESGIDNNDNYNKGLQYAGVADVEEGQHTGIADLTHFRPTGKKLDNVPKFHVYVPKRLTHAHSDGADTKCTNQDSNEQN